MIKIIIISLLIALYIIFILWYGGWGKPMSKEEVEKLILNMKKAGGKEGEPDSEIIKQFREIAESDDGREFYMVNLIKFKDNDPRSEAMATNARYTKAIIPLLLKYGGSSCIWWQCAGTFFVYRGI